MRPRKEKADRAFLNQASLFFGQEASEPKVCGSPRALADLRADGEINFRNTVATIRRRQGLVGISLKRWRTTTVGQTEDACPVEAVNRKLETGALDQVWVDEDGLAHSSVGKQRRVHLGFMHLLGVNPAEAELVRRFEHCLDTSTGPLRVLLPPRDRHVV